MRASEAKQKLCPLGFAGNAFVRCKADECIAWQVYAPAGSCTSWGKNAPLPVGYEESDQSALGARRIRATEDHGECHALPARPV